jgi:formylglycine-generating enzyme required for sulfatase activity
MSLVSLDHVMSDTSQNSLDEMRCCINPVCSASTQNDNNTDFCIVCGVSLILKNQYCTQELLGKGTFGRTFKAVELQETGVPLRIIKQFFCSSTQSQVQREIALKLFNEEADHLKSLSHPQIPKMLDFFHEDSRPYLVQQYIDGLNLERELRNEGAFNQEKVIVLLKSLLPVIDYLHFNRSIIHLDIKPANIIRERSDQTLFLVDFGSAKQATPTMQERLCPVAGSPGFIAPEQLEGRPTFPSDIYSLGVTCIHLLTKMSPFDLFDITEDRWVWRDFLGDNQVDDLLKDVLDRMINKDLANRYKSSLEVLGALNKYIPTKKTFEFTTVQLKANKLFFNRIKSIESIREASSFIEKLENGVELEMVSIPGGKFFMGPNSSERNNFKKQSNRPQHPVQVPSFYLGRTQVTQAQYNAVMQSNPSIFEGDNFPVESVSWDDAKTFCKRLTTLTNRKYRLPSEAEWEYACRAGNNDPFHFGDAINSNVANYCIKDKTINYEARASDDDYFLAKYNSGKYETSSLLNEILSTRIFGKNVRGRTYGVGSFPGNNFGLFDMHGNVNEWCEDHWHEEYTNESPINGKPWIGINVRRVVRGGSWDQTPFFCRSAYRGWLEYNAKRSYVGFRIVYAQE